MTVEDIALAAAFLAGHAHTAYRRAGGARSAILPDFLIGAHAAVSVARCSPATPNASPHTSPARP